MMFGQTDRDPMTTSLTLTSLIQNHHYHHHILRTEPGCNNMQITAALHSGMTYSRAARYDKHFGDVEGIYEIYLTE